MEEWLEIRDFSRGMNQTNAVTASEDPWDLQDVLLSEKPELRRRGPFTDRHSGGAGSWPTSLNLIPGKVLAASTYQYLGTSATVAVTSETSGGNWYVWIYIITANEAPVRKGFQIEPQTVNINGTNTTVGATMADITGAWTDPDGANDRADNRPDSFLVTTDRGTYVIGYTNEDKDNLPETLPDSNTDWHQVASSFYNLSTPTNTRLKGAGFRTCSSVGGYTFLGGRFNKDKSGHSASNAKAAPRRMWWSKLFNSESWKNSTGEIGSEGGSLVLPFTEAIRFFTELDGNLIIFTKNQIHTMSVPPGSEPTDWVLQQRAGVGTLYPRSVSRYEDSLIFANADGVYQFSGYETICLTEDSIGDLYKSQFYQQATQAQNDEAPVQRDVVGIVIGDYYVLSLNEQTGYALCCHLPTNSWVRFTNLPMLAASRTPAGDNRAFGFMLSSSNTRIVRLDRMFLPDGSSQIGATDTVTAASSPTGVGPKMKIELRRTSQTGLGVPKIWRSIAVLYDAKAIQNTAGWLTVSYAASPDKDDVTWTALDPFGPTTQMTEVRKPIASRSSAIGIRIEETFNMGKMAIASIELGYKEMRRGRG